MYYVYVGFMLFLLGQVYLTSPVHLSANFDAEVDASTLNVRAGPGLRYDVLDKLPAGSKVSILDDDVAERGRATDETWTKVFTIHEGRRIVGWVCDRYLEHSSNSDVAIAKAGDSEAQAAGRSVAPGITDTFDAEVFYAVSGLPKPADPEIAPEWNGTTDRVLAAILPQRTAAPTTTMSDWTPGIALLAPPEPPVSGEPLSFDALGIDCRRSYFGSAIEACTTRIAIRLYLPEYLTGFVEPSVPISCDVAYRYTMAAEEMRETVSATVDVELHGGTGTAIAGVPMTFVDKLAEVTQVSAEQVSCRPLAAMR